MSQLVKMKRQAYFKHFKRFGAFKGIVEQKNIASTRSCVNWAFLALVDHSCLKKPNLHTNEFLFLWNYNKSSAITSKQHSLFLFHDDVGKCDEKFSS
jgi:hypothetical protein